MAIDKITTPAVTDDSVTLAKMAPGTDGNIISYDASGNPVAVLIRKFLVLSGQQMQEQLPSFSIRLVRWKSFTS